jgi:hypothetical protein
LHGTAAERFNEAARINETTKRGFLDFTTQVEKARSLLAKSKLHK